MKLKLESQEIKSRAKKRVVKRFLSTIPLIATAIFVVVLASSQLFRLVSLAVLALFVLFIAYSVIGMQRVVLKELESLIAEDSLEELISQKILNEEQGVAQELKKIEDQLNEDNGWRQLYPLPQVAQDSTYSVGLGIKNMSKARTGRNEVALRVSNGSSVVKEQKSQWGCFMSFKASVKDQITIEIFSPRKVATEYALSVSLEGETL